MNVKITLLTGILICAAGFPVCGQSNGESEMEQRLTLITLGVSDLERSTEFYEDNFGWKKAGTSNENISFFQLNGIMFSLFERDELAADAGVDAAGEGFSGFSLSYNTRSEKEVDDIIEALRDNGVKIAKEPQKVFWGGYSSYIADPDGYLWEIAFNPYMELDEEGNVKGAETGYHETIQAYYRSYKEADSKTLRGMLTDDFRHISSFSEFDDPDEMLNTIWPEVGKSWAEELEIFGEHPEYMVRYKVIGGDQPARTMSEYIRFEGDKIAEIEVFTGREVE